MIVENAGGFVKGHKHGGRSLYGGQGESDLKVTSKASFREHRVGKDEPGE